MFQCFNIGIVCNGVRTYLENTMVAHVLSEVGEGWDGSEASAKHSEYLNVTECGPGGDKKKKETGRYKAQYE